MWWICWDHLHNLFEITYMPKIEIITLISDGDATKEYILLKALEDVNINDYAVVDKTFNNKGNVTNVHRHFYRFPKKDIKKDEYISLRTGEGSNELGVLKDLKTPVHRFYWQSNAPIWNDKDAERAELLYVKTVDQRNT